MEISLTTPALLFPAISLLMLAYTNRFLTLATIIRNLHDRYQNQASDNLLGQVLREVTDIDANFDWESLFLPLTVGGGGGTYAEGAL